MSRFILTSRYTKKKQNTKIKTVDKLSLKHCLATKKAYKNQKETLNAQITIKLLFYFERRIRNNCPFTQCISSIHVELISISKYGNETPLFDRIKNSKLQTQTENGDIKKYLTHNST